MKKSLYDILHVSQSADQDVMAITYQFLLNKHLSNENEDSKNQIKFIQHAYKVLSDPNQRRMYDQRLKEAEQSKPQYQAEYKREPADTSNSWWKGSKSILIVFTSLVLIGFSVFSSGKNKVEIAKQAELTKQESNLLNATNDSKHLNNEEVLVKGVIQNQNISINEVAKVNNSALDIARQAEDHKRMELENRANIAAQRIELERRAQEARIAAQEEVLRQQKTAYENAMAERSRRYYACYNNALDRGYDRTQAENMCHR